ncbi:type II toxin-antitoxin system HipA family toxin [Microbacterium schleiferi]|uniref:type II toxin-antitoxin system HipA family toxin n=1 Tax=Microbacterium schleiferi TaxID=69362 RepID=UPI00311D43CF
MTDALPVRLYDTRIGTLERTARGGVVLRWSREAIDRWGENSRVLSAGLRVGVDDEHASEAFFGGLLPEGEHIARLAREVKVDRGDVVGLLAEVGADLAGALRVGHLEAQQRDPEKLDIDAVGALLDRASGFLIGGGGSALPGFQRKLTLTRRDGSWWRGNGVIPSTHILKPVAAEYVASVESENYALQVARHPGLLAFETWTETVAGRPVLVVERYDRVDDGDTVRRIHQEDAAQALRLPWGGNDKFEQNNPSATLRGIAGLLDTGRTVFETPYADRLRLARYAAFTIAVGNTDAHAKNFSLLHDERGRITLAPIYDAAPLALAYDATDALALRINGVTRLPDVTASDLVAEATSWGVPDGEARAAIDETLTAIVEATRDVHAHPAIEAHVPGYIRGQAENLLAGRPARISSTIPLALRERIGSPQDRDA